MSILVLGLVVLVGSIAIWSNLRMATQQFDEIHKRIKDADAVPQFDEKGTDEMTDERRLLPPAPLSFGPDALCARFDGGNGTCSIAWLTLGSAVVRTQRDLAGIEHPDREVKLVTVHLLKDGKVGVSVDDIPRMFVFTPDAFVQLLREHGQVQRVH